MRYCFDISKFVKYILMCFTGVVTAACFVMVLFFGIAGILAVTQASAIQFLTIISFCILFGIAGTSFMTCTGLLHDSVRR